METNEIVKALGRPIELACELIGSLLGKPFTVAGEILNDQIQEWQWRNRIAIAERAERILREKQIARRVLPPDFIIPMFRAWGDISDETLQETWARLLASAVEQDSHQYIPFLKTLEQLSGNDVKALDALIRSCPTGNLIERRSNVAVATGLDTATVALSMANMEHLGFFTPTQKRVRTFAIRFSEACITDPSTAAAYDTAQRHIASEPVFD